MTPYYQGLLRFPAEYSAMNDIVDSTTRSKMMSAIRSKDTKPELLVRKGLHRLGFRYRLHEKRLPGRPDIVLPRYKVIILVNGCFWHGHSCHLFKWPQTRDHFWREKILKNMARDRKNINEYKRLGWRTRTIWECDLKGKSSEEVNSLLLDCHTWIKSDPIT